MEEQLADQVVATGDALDNLAMYGTRVFGPGSILGQVLENRERLDLLEAETLEQIERKANLLADDIRAFRADVLSGPWGVVCGP